MIKSYFVAMPFTDFDAVYNTQDDIIFEEAGICSTSSPYSLLSIDRLKSSNFEKSYQILPPDDMSLFEDFNTVINTHKYLLYTYIQVYNNSTKEISVKYINIDDDFKGPYIINNFKKIYLYKTKEFLLYPFQKNILHD